METTVLEELSAFTTLRNTMSSVVDSKLTKPTQPTNVYKRLLDKLDINIPKEAKSVSTF